MVRARKQVVQECELQISTVTLLITGRLIVDGVIGNNAGAGNLIRFNFIEVEFFFSSQRIQGRFKCINVGDRKHVVFTDVIVVQSQFLKIVLFQSFEEKSTATELTFGQLGAVAVK